MIEFPKKYPDISKREFVEGFVKKSGAKSVVSPSAVFMAGLPGAGKTEFSRNKYERKCQSCFSCFYG
jgi:hypothetical protein